MQRSKLYFISSTLPPRVCGVGDYTAHLSAKLSTDFDIKILTSCSQIENLGDVKVEQLFKPTQPSDIFSVIQPLILEKPDWLFIQYDPFSYGAKYGFNPYLALTLNILRNRCPNTKIGLVVHESFLPIQTWKTSLLSTWLKVQLWTLAYGSDLIFLTVEPWVQKLKHWFPSKAIFHLPVSSNIPTGVVNRLAARKRLGIKDETIVLGLFGRIQRTRSLKHITQSVNQLQQLGFQPLVLYLGLDPDGARKCLSEVPLVAIGPLSPEKIAEQLSAVDIYLVPINEGVSTRRTSLMTGLQQGLATVATIGEETGSMLIRENEQALLLVDVDSPDRFAEAVCRLAENPLYRSEIARCGQELFYREFSWNRISAKFLAALEDYKKHCRNHQNTSLNL